MKRFLSVLILTVGCGSLQADYVAADRATYKAMKPCIDAGIAAVGTMEGKAYKLLVDSWDGRLVAAEEKIKKQEAK
jgi:hypothetical protein